MSEEARKKAWDELVAKFASEKAKPYEEWVRAEGLDILDAQYVRNLRKVPLKPWTRRGGNAAFLNHDASRHSNDCYIMEIPAGGKLNQHRQMYEEMVFVLDGRGSTKVWNNAGKSLTFEWKAGAIFGVPMNCWHQHFNGSGSAPVRYVAVTNAPPVINLYKNLDFVFNNPFEFTDRFNGEPDYFAAKNDRDMWTIRTNFIPDAVNIPLAIAHERGAGGQHLRFTLANSSQQGHLSQFPIQTYKKAHAHGPGAHVVILSGEGYSLCWNDGLENPPDRFDWEVGTLIVPRDNVYHQHFNTGPEPARYLAFRTGSSGVKNSQGVVKCFYSKRIGGHQLDYADESPTFRRMFEEALTRHNLAPAMDAAYEKEKETLPPVGAEIPR